MSGMTRYCWRWALGKLLVVGGAFGAAVSQTLAFSGNCAFAQSNIVPDNSLGVESSVVTPNVDIKGITSDQIHGGAIRGANLFHSFGEFNIDSGRGAYFTNPAGIENIFSRVTGGNRSEIFGKLGVLGNANLFLINPSGIIFGRNASLDVKGSFVASTASSLNFTDGIKFSATTPQTTSLLTISVPLGLQFGTNPGKIQVQGDGQGIRSTDELIDTTSGLRVQPNQTLALVGGDVSLEGATLKTAGGRVELGSVGDNSLVSLTPINKGFSLGYDTVSNFGNIQLSQQTAVDASGAGGGDIQIWGKRVTLTNGSRVEASTLGAERGGGLVLNATELLEVSDTFSGLATAVYQDATGMGGELRINTPKLIIQDGAIVSIDTLGKGNGGNLFVNADQLIVRDGAQINAGTLGQGNGGNLFVNATERVELSGFITLPNGQTFVSGLFVPTVGMGNAGDLRINTREMIMRNRSEVSVSTFSDGNAGNLFVNANQLIMEDGSLIAAGTTVKGNGGNLFVNADQLILRDGAQITAGTRGAGKGGNLIINATNKVELIGGVSADGDFTSIVAQSQLNATGDAGDLTINTPQLLVGDRSRVSADTFGKGNGGNLFVNADQLIVRDGSQITAGTRGAGKGGNLIVNATDKVELSGFNTLPNGKTVVSGLFTQAANQDATGAAGDLMINTRHLLVQDRAIVNAGTLGAGKGGNLTVNASDSVQVIGGQFPSGLFTQAEPNATGAAGDLTINTRDLLVRDGSGVFVRSLGTGNAGNLTVNARSIRLDNKATLTADTRSRGTDSNKEQATITLGVRDLLLLGRGSTITTNARGENVIGGNININTDFLVAVENSDISANSTDFRGGRVTINATGIFGTQFRDARTPESDITATGASPELNGTVEINTPDVDPNRGLVNLPTVPLDSEVSQICQPRTAENQSSFIITGRGGLPPNPRTEPLSGDAVQVDWVTLKPRGENRTSTNVSKPTSPTPAPIVEAQGWVRNSKGEVVLTAYAPTATPHNSWFPGASCP